MKKKPVLSKKRKDNGELTTEHNITFIKYQSLSKKKAKKTNYIKLEMHAHTHIYYGVLQWQMFLDSNLSVCIMNLKIDYIF